MRSILLTRQLVKESFEPRQKFIYEEAERLIQRREYDLAIEALAKGYLYCFEPDKGNVPEGDQYAEKIRRQAIVVLTENINEAELEELGLED